MKDAKGHGSNARGLGQLVSGSPAWQREMNNRFAAPKAPTLHEEANMRARSAGGMSAEQIAAHPDFGGRYNVPTVNAVLGDRAAASELARGNPKSAAAPVHPGASGPQYSREAVNNAIASSNRAGRRIGGKEAGMIHRLLKGRH